MHSLIKIGLLLSLVVTISCNPKLRAKRSIEKAFNDVKIALTHYPELVDTFELRTVDTLRLEDFSAGESFTHSVDSARFDSLLYEYVRQLKVVSTVNTTNDYLTLQMAELAGKSDRIRLIKQAIIREILPDTALSFNYSIPVSNPDTTVNLELTFYIDMADSAFTHTVKIEGFTLPYVKTKTEINLDASRGTPILKNGWFYATWLLLAIIVVLILGILKRQGIVDFTDRE